MARDHGGVGAGPGEQGDQARVAFQNHRLTATRRRFLNQTREQDFIAEPGLPPNQQGAVKAAPVPQRDPKKMLPRARFGRPPAAIEIGVATRQIAGRQSDPGAHPTGARQVGVKGEGRLEGGEGGGHRAAFDQSGGQIGV